MARADPISVEVVVATRDRQELVALTIGGDATAADALARSGLAARFPEMNLDDSRLAVWGRPVAADHVLRDGDRVEVLRPLLIDPRDTRRELAKDGQVMGTTAGKGGD